MEQNSERVFLFFGEKGSAKEKILNKLFKNNEQHPKYWPRLVTFGDFKMMIFQVPDFNSSQQDKEIQLSIIRNTKSLMNELQLPKFHILFFLSDNLDDGLFGVILKNFDVKKEQITFVTNKEYSQVKQNKAQSYNFIELKQRIEVDNIRHLFKTLDKQSKPYAQEPSSSLFEKIIKSNEKIDFFNFSWYLKFIIEIKKQQNKEKEPLNSLLSIYNSTADCINCKPLCCLNDQNYKYFTEVVQTFQPPLKCDCRKQNNYIKQNSENISYELDALNESSEYIPSSDKPQDDYSRAQNLKQKQNTKPIQTQKICNDQKQNIKERRGSKISALFLFCEDKIKYHIFQSLSGSEIIDQKNFNKHFFEEQQIEIIDAPIFTFLDDSEETINMFSQFFSNQIIHYIFLFLEYQRIDIMKRRLDSMLKQLLKVDKKQMALVVIGWENCDREEEDKEMIEQMIRTRSIDKSLFYSDKTNSIHLLKENMFECMTANDLEKLSFAQTVFAEDLIVKKEPKKQFQYKIPSKVVGSLKIRNKENLE